MEIEQKRVDLGNGLRLPLVGQEDNKLGTYKVTDRNEMVTYLRRALDLGYRHIDTAIMYENESLLGEALQEIYKEGNYKREDIILATKLFTDKDKAIEDVVRSSLANLQTTYIDIYYIHYSATPPNQMFQFKHKPIHQAWAELEACVEKGLIKHIAVSNFNVQILLDLYSYCKIKPVINQIEVNIFLQQPRLIEFCNKINLHVTAFSPLARCQNTSGDDVLNEVAKKYKKTVPQIMLQFLMSIGVSVIPKTSNLDRLKENIESAQFKLEEEDIVKLKGLNKNQRLIEPYVREWWSYVPYFD